jgi:phenylalanyl-tRNA synthetase beta chain
LRVPDPDVRRILDSLGFAPREAADGWDVTVPTRRVDVRREVDLIEEVVRHYGFDRIPVTFPALAAAPPPVDPRVLQARALRAVMNGAGFSEAVTFGFIQAPAAAAFAPSDDIVPIANPLSEQFAVLRPSLVPGLIDALAHNRRREQHDVRLFELGSRFSRTAGERRALAFAWTGAADAGHWSTSSRTVDFFDVKGAVERVADALDVELDAEPVREEWLAPGRAAAISASAHRIGTFGQLAPAIAERHGLPAADAVYVAEIDLDAADALQRDAGFRIEALPRHPSVTRDISIVVDAALPARAVRQTVRDAGPPTLVGVHEFDRYQGKGIPEQRVSLSLRLVFRAADRTLTDAEVQQAMDVVMTALRDRHDATQR